MRIRIVFSKLDQMRFTGHLDLLKTWERTFRRAGIPVTYSQGYNPRPRINIGATLPLGFTGESELMDVWLDIWCLPAGVLESLEPALPPGIMVKSIQEVEPDSPSLQRLISASDFIVTLPVFVNELQSRLTDLLREKEIWRERRGKSYNLRPLILDLSEIRSNDNSTQQLKMRLLTRESATGRPDEVLSSLSIEPHRTRIHRLRLIIS